MATPPSTPAPAPPAPPTASAAAPSIHLHPPRFPQISPVKLEPASTTPLPSTLPHPHPDPHPTPSPSTSLTITIPSCSRWFSFDAIHDTERRILPEFFDGKSPSRNPDAYKYYRDSIIRQFRANPSQKLTFTEARRRLIGDIGSVRRVFDFLEGWGLINYVPLAKPLVRREGEEGMERKERTQRLCGSCKSPCSLACFVTDKADFILCTRCYVRGNYRPGLSSSDFKRFDISEETKTEWTDKETLHLLEAILQYGEDWKRVAEHVGSRSEKECVARFVKLPFGEQFLRPEGGRADSRQYQGNDQASGENGETNVEDKCDSKRRRLTPLADASNPIMAQVAFLSAMVGSEVVRSASQAAIAALHDVDPGNVSGANGLINEAVEGENFGENDVESVEEVFEQAQSQHKKEQQEVEQSISDIIEVQMKEIQEKIVRFEATELELEKERLELCYMKDLLFADQLSLLQHKARLKLFEGRDGEKTRASNANL